MSLSLDLDNLWSYLFVNGDPSWKEFPSYLDTFVDLVLEKLREHELTITFFIVGQDAALECNARALRAIADAGHEIANHSFHHEPWLHTKSVDEVREELATAERHIHNATGQRTVGFRGPGFSMGPTTLRALAQLGYVYDASSLPTYIGPLARAYYFFKSKNLAPEQRERRKDLFGRLRDGWRPLRPYTWEVDDLRLLEIPVTTMPVTRAPFHLSYIHYLSGYSRWLARLYLKASVRMCRMAGVEPSYLLHPLDFLGGDRVSELGFFPGMQTSTSKKMTLFDDVISYFKRHFTIVTMREHAERARSESAADSRLHPLTS